MRFFHLESLISLIERYGKRIKMSLEKETYIEYSFIVKDVTFVEFFTSLTHFGITFPMV